MLQWCGPGVLSGIKLNDWVSLLRAHGRQIDISRLPRICSITVQSLKNSAFGVVERSRFAEQISKVVIQPPLFVLGHWRSGTTHLHQLLCQDERFAFPNTYQTSFPHIFLTTEAIEAPLLRHFIPASRPMDNMDLSFASPQEDEFALCSTSLRSSCMQWVFPRQKELFKKYLTLKNANATEVAQWKEALLTFIRKVQWRSGRPLILKSPQHTGRIRLLLELFPEAKFVHIHRDPVRVFQSSRRSLSILLDWHSLQRSDTDSLEDWVIEQYREMYDAFFEEKELVPSGRFHEVCYEQLEGDTIGELQKLYRALDLPEFSSVEPRVRQYVDSLTGYRKNAFSELPEAIKKRLRREWKVCFEAWGY